ncbi:uncharacterized protein LOC119955677 [Scyliorhinus canicula]|uniref:uncharacterized protein LOC119955677 n=1 Tax=Scyliorhinus canicula TaxID=7830 RepID=UPI0018F5ED99|nr:uncharacterized protein LOC119955677 [Scyliorhinus canicula]
MGAMAVLTVLIFITANLIGSLSIPPRACKMLGPRKINTTSPEFIGKWYLLRWTTQYEPYRRQFSQLDNAFIVHIPVLQTNTTLIKAYMRAGNNCISEMEAYRLSKNGLELTCETRPFTVTRILNSKSHCCLLYHIQEKKDGKLYNTISLYSRNATRVEKMVKIFEEQLHCAGMKKDKVVVLPRKKEECDLQNAEETASQK